MLKWLVPLFFLTVTIVIMVLNDVFGERDGFIVFSLLFFLTMTLFIIRWVFRQIKAILTLKREKTQAELMHLKSQVNPHFFFNTLNNLYGLVKVDSERAQALILKLSDMMRYSIYDGQKELVSLREEVDYLENYIELHRMRYHKKINISFEKKIEDSELQISPLLFIILLENAFKHGVENLRKDAFVNIILESSGNHLSLDLKNNFDPEEVSLQGGIGLKNLKRRLELLYPKKHDLVTSIDDGVYHAHLTLSL